LPPSPTEPRSTPAQQRGLAYTGLTGDEHQATARAAPDLIETLAEHRQLASRSMRSLDVWVLGGTADGAMKAHPPPVWAELQADDDA
jgi:hypothetical protein